MAKEAQKYFKLVLIRPIDKNNLVGTYTFSGTVYG